jgi:hypothetical protein
MENLHISPSIGMVGERLTQQQQDIFSAEDHWQGCLEAAVPATAIIIA